MNQLAASPGSRALVSFAGTGQAIEVPGGTTILQAARLAGIVIESP